MQELMVPTDDERTWGTVAHLSAFVAPFVGPLLILLIYQDKSRFVRYHALQALLMGALLSATAVFAVVAISVISMVTCGVGSFLFMGAPLLMVPPLYEAYMAWQGEWKTLPGIEEFGR